MRKLRKIQWEHPNRPVAGRQRCRPLWDRAHLALVRLLVGLEMSDLVRHVVNDCMAALRLDGLDFDQMAMIQNTGSDHGSVWPSPAASPWVTNTWVHGLHTHGSGNR